MKTEIKYVKDGAFQNAPLPWRYDAKTRNILADDGSIVARNGDSVHGDHFIGECIVKAMNLLGSEPSFILCKVSQ